MNTIWLAFLSGLTTGGISCLAVQGGLLATTVASIDESGTGLAKWRHVTWFLISKLVAYTIVGYILGSLGAALTLSPKMLGSLQILAGFLMLVTAARLLDIHPIFRYFVITPPRFIYRFMRTQSREATYITPVLLGALTVLMPCGVTQATMAIAIASGSPILGAAIMFAFVLGTSPVFFALGASVAELLQRKRFVYLAAGVVGIFAILSINGGMALRGSFYTLQNFYKAATLDVGTVSTIDSRMPPLSKDGFQTVNIAVRDNGYTASSSVLKVGIPVRVVLATERTKGCARAFTIPDYGVSKILPETGQEVVEFTPTKTGRLAFACSMGMYTGEFNVISAAL